MLDEKTATSWVEGFVKFAAAHGVEDPEEVRWLMKVAARLELAAKHPDAFEKGAQEKEAAGWKWMDPIAGAFRHLIPGGETYAETVHRRQQGRAGEDIARQRRMKARELEVAQAGRQQQQEAERARIAGMSRPELFKYQLAQRQKAYEQQMQQREAWMQYQQQLRQMQEQYAPQQSGYGRGGYGRGGYGGRGYGVGYPRRWSPSPYSYRGGYGYRV